uniref:Armadillo repeat-containing domain-containing protein n=1 Tax=Takifugu rubripes TaxID=31033 RepID=A0A3B5KH31_TAKRU
MNIPNQDQVKVCLNSDLQLGALRLLTNLSVTDQHQHLLKTSIRLLLSLLVVGNEALQVGFFVIKGKNSNSFQQFLVQAIICNSCLMWSNYDYSIDTSPVLLRLLTFAGNLKAWRPSTQVADILRQKQDCLFRVMLDESSQLNNRLFQLLSHPDGEIQARVARILT